MRIVPIKIDGKYVRGCRWKMFGKSYALGYTPGHLFGKRLRRTRSALLRSVEITIEQVSARHA